MALQAECSHQRRLLVRVRALSRSLSFNDKVYFKNKGYCLEQVRFTAKLSRGLSGSLCPPHARPPAISMGRGNVPAHGPTYSAHRQGTTHLTLDTDTGSALEHRKEYFHCPQTPLCPPLPPSP